MLQLLTPLLTSFRSHKKEKSQVYFNQVSTQGMLWKPEVLHGSVLKRSLSWWSIVDGDISAY